MFKTYKNYLLQEKVGDGGSLSPSFMLRAGNLRMINAIACDEVRTCDFSWYMCIIFSNEVDMQNNHKDTSVHLYKEIFLFYQ